MHKHNRKQVWGGSKGGNANSPLPRSAIASIESLMGFLDGQECFSATYLRSEYLSKFCSEDGTPSRQRQQNAIDKWLMTEKKNAYTNKHLRGLDRGYNLLPRVTFYAFLKFAQKLISDILGPLTNEIVVGSFSGGASTSRRRTESLPAFKFSGQADGTSGALELVGVIHHEIPLFRQHGIFYSLREVEGAKLFTVPKKSDIDRCACKEPDINMYLQKGVGRHIRRRLFRFGVDLSDQSINRELARVGSIDGSLATLDLSSASDTVTISCVEALLPRDWFLYLNDIRSHCVELPDGTIVRTEMFSSMGNGFTFELESLIFYALMRTTAYFEHIRGAISVYGDDIIIPVGMYDSACWVLSEFGFSPNLDKSFSEGPFRESCGGHYHSGEDVTPFYLKRPPTHMTDVIRVANQLRRWALADPCRQYVFPDIHKTWISLRDLVPKALWGGRDLSVDTQLVTPDAPTKRLMRSVKRRRVPDIGAYVDWHNSNWNRSSDPKEGFTPVRTDSFCRLRRAIPGAPTLGDEFYEEIVAMPVPR